MSRNCGGERVEYPQINNWPYVTDLDELERQEWADRLLSKL